MVVHYSLSSIDDSVIFATFVFAEKKLRCVEKFIPSYKLKHLLSAYVLCVKGIVHQVIYSVINYSSCCSKPVRFSFFFGKQINNFLLKSETFLYQNLEHNEGE